MQNFFSLSLIFSKDSQIFVADKLSEQNKLQLEQLNIEWVEMRAKNGYQKFEKILTKLKIPHYELIEIVEAKIDKIFGKYL